MPEVTVHGNSENSLLFLGAGQIAPGELGVNDLSVVGSLAGGGDWGAVDLIYIPEPSTVVLLVLGLVGVVAGARRR